VTAFAELCVTSNFSFLRGASHGEELVVRAKELGLAGLGLADRNTLAGVVRAHAAAKAQDGFRLIVGARLTFRDGTPDILCYPRDRAAYGRLCQILTTGNLRAEKGDCLLDRADFLARAEGMQAIVIAAPSETLPALLHDIRQAAGAVWLAAPARFDGDDMRRRRLLKEIGMQTGARLIATTEPLHHTPERKALLDVLTCVREKTTLDDAGSLLTANAERHLKPPGEIARLFRDTPQAIEETKRFLDGVTFSLDELAYEYPDECVTGYPDPQTALEALTWEGAAQRFAGGIPDKIRINLARELKIVENLKFAPYFLTVQDIVRWARAEQDEFGAKKKPILCQGRGSAANSSICYCLHITEVNPNERQLLFDRFVSEERGEPPDIDVDFEHERREDVIQYVYRKYGRHRAGLAATVISYRGRSAIREVGKAFGFSEDQIGALSKSLTWWRQSVSKDDLKELGIDTSDTRLMQCLALSDELQGFPRHLSQHVGGFVITRGPLNELGAIQNARMADRTVVEWDKNDLETLNILKIDLLGLGMLTCLKIAFDLFDEHYGDSGEECITLASPPNEPAVYEMLQRADTVGVFQVESRAQMSMLPRLQPKEFYDLVIEVAIVRPGPIQGGMVHPYLKRRQKLEKVTYPNEALKEVLKRTLGVPLFQEQAMQMAIVGANFTPPEADKLRRAMATFRRVGTIQTLRAKFIQGMLNNGLSREYAEACFKQIEGFGEYGFPESHAASFAILVYASAWMKCHYPDIFAAALLNAQPMGFYAPAQLVRDARDHGVDVRAPDINASEWDCTLETLEGSAYADPPLNGEGGRAAVGRGVAVTTADVPREAFARTQSPSPPLSSLRDDSSPIEGQLVAGVRKLPQRYEPQRSDIRTTHALRLGFREVRGLKEDEVNLLVAKRGAGYDSMRDLWLRTNLPVSTLERLADADAFGSLGLTRRDGLWAARGLNRVGGQEDLPLFAGADGTEKEPDFALPPLPLGAQVIEDYRHLSLSLKAHPAQLLRAHLKARGAITADELGNTKNGVRVRVAGLVLVRQRPGTASGVVFMTLEDETHIANIIVWPKIFEKFRAKALAAKLCAVEGIVQSESGVIHVIAEKIADWSPLLTHLSEHGQQIRPEARADETRSSRPDPRNDETAEAMPGARNFH
jgi:error-prone DNA polymerase